MNQLDVAGRNHQRFLAQLGASHGTVAFAAQWLTLRGHDVTIAPERRHDVQPSHAQWKDWADNGDLFLTRGGIQHRVEVKGLSAQFSCRADWPFGSKFIVCAKHAWDRADPKPAAFLAFAKDRGAVAITHHSSSPRWTTAWRQDRRYEDVSQEYYFAPLDAVKFMEVE